ncbi:MAG: carbohydrate binding family 9 domain-containing protein [Candidatus Zixiibacteriota bacterium]|nr:MAG: carbohydrate binding family 9 domain-containing protein [candidate division Zixibacteria bacterium]
MISLAFHRSLHCTALILAGIMLASAPAPVSATSDPVFHPTLEITKTSNAINIDGDLNDPGWKAAAWSDNFVERHPGDNIAPLVETKVLVTYNDDYLYVGFLCYDERSAIRATMCQRDQYFGDDAVCVLLDTYGNASWAYEFFVNPHGIQKDNLWTNIIGEDSGFDVIWNSAAKITNSGYQVEMAIPFASIRFPNTDSQSWRMDFWRIHPRESYHQYSWAAYDRNEQCWPCQWGTVNGIRDVHPGRGIEILPAVIADQSGSVTDAYDPKVPFDNEKIDGELSVGAKYAITSDVTVEASFNPDFSQIEADAAQIDVNTFVALYYPERRPFFQEGQDIFRTLFNSFYTRSIHDPQLALKLTGRADSYRFGFFSAVDENTFYVIPLEESSLRPFNVGKSYVNVLRGMRSFGGSSQLGFIINDRRFEAGGHNSVFGLDQNVRLSRNYIIDGQYLITYTKEPNDSALFYNRYTFDQDKYTLGFDGESYTGYAFISRFRRIARHWGLFIDYNQVGRAYRTQVGYDPWVNYRNLTGWTGYTLYFDEGIFERMTPQVSTNSRWNFEDERKWSHYNASWSGRLRLAQTNFSVTYGTGMEVWSGIRYNDLWHISFNTNSRFSDQFGYYLSAERGIGPARYVMAKGNEISFSTGLDFKPIDRLLIEPNFDYVHSSHTKTGEKLFENYVIRTRLRLQATRALSLRLVVQHTYRYELQPIWNGTSIEYVTLTDKHWNVDPLITFRISPFSVFYIGTTYDYKRLPDDPYPFRSSKPNPSLSPNWKLSSRKFFMKLQYLFQT